MRGAADAEEDAMRASDHQRREGEMTASVLAVGAGTLLLAIASRASRFERVVGPALHSQHRVVRQLPRFGEVSEARHLRIARFLMLAAGVLCTAVGLAGIISIAG